MRAPAVARSPLLWVGLAVSVLFTYLALRGVDYDELWQALRASHPWWLLPALAALAAGIGLRAVRWWSLFAPDSRPPLAAVAKALLLGYFFNSILPLRAGEAARVLWLRRRAGVSAVQCGATIVVERTFDVLCLLALFFVALPWIPDVSWTDEAAALAGGVTVAVIAIAVAVALYEERPLRFLLRPLAFLPFLSSERLAQAARSGVDGLAALRNARISVLAFALTAMSWLVLSLSFWLVLVSFDLGLSAFAGLLVAVATGVALILPSTSGALGVFEAATVVALAAYGVPRSEALSCALVLHALNFLPFVVVGYVLLHAEGAAWTRGLGVPAAADPAPDR